MSPITVPDAGDETEWRPLRPFGAEGHDAPRFAYSLGVQSGRQVWIAGQIARDAQGDLVGLDDPEAQAIQVYSNIRDVLREAGGDLEDLVATTTYVTARAYREVVTAVRHRFLPGPDHPANTLCIVAGLAIPEYLVEVEGTAIVGARSASRRG